MVDAHILVSKARDMINEKIGTSNFEGGSRGIVYGSANGYGNCAGGQPDYSAQWAEYYRYSISFVCIGLI